MIARKGGDERRVAVRGRDIYAITAPIAIDAVERMSELDRGGTFALGELGDATQALRRLERAGHLRLH